MFLRLRHHGMWPLLVEHLLSVVWACCVAAVLLASVAELLGAAGAALAAQLQALRPPAAVVTSGGAVAAVAKVAAAGPAAAPAASLTTLLPEFSGVLIVSTCLVQMLLSMLLDRRYDYRLLRYYPSIIWYPFWFWMLNMLTVVAAMPKLALRRAGARARWVSPDRGIAP